MRNITIKVVISQQELKSTMTLEETLNHLNQLVCSEYGVCFPIVLKIDIRANTYELTLPSDNEENLPIVLIGNYYTNDKQEYTALMLEKMLDDATRRLECIGLELWCNTTSYVLNPCDYTVFRNIPAIISEWRKEKKESELKWQQLS